MIGIKQVDLGVAGCIFACLPLEDRENLAQTSRFWRDARKITSVDCDALTQYAIRRRRELNLLSPLAPVMAHLKTIPAAAARLLHVRTLNVSGLRLDALDLAALVAAAPQIEDLDAQDNRLSELPEPLWQLRGLRRLNLRLNAITQVDSGLSSLRALECLNLNGNPIEHFADVFDDLPNLRQVCLVDCRLAQLPDSLRRAARRSRMRLFHGPSAPSLRVGAVTVGRQTPLP